MRLASSILTPDLASELNKLDDEKEIVKAIEDTPQVQTVLEKEGNP